MTKDRNTGLWAIAWQTLRGIAVQPVCWVGFFLLPLVMFFFLDNLMEQGLPTRIPSAIVDLDLSTTSRRMSQNVAGMQMVDIQYAANDYTQARHLMQEGKIYGYFMIPRNFEQDFKAGRNPVVTFYTNMTYLVPASLLFKTFKTSATYEKAGLILSIAQDAGLPTGGATGLLNPVSVVMHPIHNPWLNYSYYLCVGFLPGVLQLMILLMTSYTLGENVKYGRAAALFRMGHGSILRTVTGIMLPQTVIWVVVALFLESWMFGWNGYPMHGSLLWLTVSSVMFVLASQGFGLVIFGAFPNLRMGLSVSALLGILTFSIAAFSFPVESMYPAVGIFSWIVPVRYYYLIYVDQALNGISLYYSRMWYLAYLIFMVAPLLLMWRIRKAYARPVYVP